MYGQIGRLTQRLPASGKGRWGRIRLPLWIASALMRAAGRILYALKPGFRRRLVENMGEVLTAHSPRELKRLTRSYLIQLAYGMYELLVDYRRLPSAGEKLIRLEGEEHVEKALSEGRGAILYAPHTGNFFYYYWRLSQKYNCLAVATAGSPELRPIYLSFQAMGCQGLDYDDTPPLEMLRVLRTHLANGGVVFILGDFYRPSFPHTQLLGKKTRSAAGAAALALEHKVPVVPCYGYRERGFRHVLEFSEPMRFTEAYSRAGRDQAMLVLNEILSERIRRKPDQWFYWFESHLRWETEPSE